MTSEPKGNHIGKLATIAVISAGSYYEQSNKLFSLMGVKFPSLSTYDRNLRGCHEAITEVLEDVFAENLKVEKNLAILNNEIAEDGTIKLKVICDSGYSMKNNGILF
jgi:hypothetical protein